jgi:4-hydroxy-tetrahydrodipicolinate reductase
MVKIGISGACGKMGQRIIALAKEDKNLKVVFGLEDKNSPNLGKVMEGIKISADSSQINSCDCLIDFSVPQATLEYLDYAVKYKKGLVIGTTGLNEQINKIKTAAKKIPIVFSPNMSIGVNLLFRLVAEAARVLKGYQVYLQEAHHVHKKDAPSGTAKRIVQILDEAGFKIKDEEVKVIREGEIVGDHKVFFESGLDKLELTHRAKDRDIFAKGALLAAGWVVSKTSGLYSMQDVLFG